MKIMKRLILATLLTAIAADAQAMTIFARSARRYVGKMVTVNGVVSSIRQDRKATYLYLEGRYPHNELTAVIPVEAQGAFPQADTSVAKVVDVSGVIHMNGRIPEITLRDPGQLYVKD